MAAVPHNYMLGAFTYGWFAGVNAAQYVNAVEDSELNQSEIEAEKLEYLRHWIAQKVYLQNKWNISCAVL